MSANSNKQPVAIVTGASSGMGLGIAPNAQTEVGNYSCFDCFASEVGSFGSRSLRFSESGTRLVTPDP
jgi:hypothetical protein